MLQHLCSPGGSLGILRRAGLAEARADLHGDRLNPQPTQPKPPEGTPIAQGLMQQNNEPSGETPTRGPGARCPDGAPCASPDARGASRWAQVGPDGLSMDPDCARMDPNGHLNGPSGDAECHPDGPDGHLTPHLPPAPRFLLSLGIAPHINSGPRPIFFRTTPAAMGGPAARHRTPRRARAQPHAPGLI